MDIPSNTYIVDPKRLKKNKTELGCTIVFSVFWILVTIFATLYVVFYPNGFLYFWVTFALLGTLLLLHNFTFLKRNITFRIEGDELLISGLKFSSRSERRIHNNDIEALALEVYDEDSFLSLTLWKKGSIVWQVPLTSFIHPRHMVVIFEDIKNFLHQHDFDFVARSSIPPEECWPSMAQEEQKTPTYPKTRRIVRNIIGIRDLMDVGERLIFVELGDVFNI